jgi:hypothetical protein
MDFFPLHVARSQLPGQRFDPWAIEIATMNHSARNIAALVDGVVLAIMAGARVLAGAVQSLRKACPVEVEPVQVARPTGVAQQNLPANDRAAA